MTSFTQTCQESEDPTIPFACQAWRTATGPVMVPGYARMHLRILPAQVVGNEWDGCLAADVSVITGWAAALCGSRE